MSATLRKLYTENDNPFKLSLCAGKTSVRNEVTWVYGVEDENLIPYFHGSELAVTTGVKMQYDANWLMLLVPKLVERQVAGLIVNVGKFIQEIPQDVIDYCNEKEFPLFTMPWEIRITEMIQTFCRRIIAEKQETTLHDKAMRDAIMKRENIEEYREILSKYYNLNGIFTVLMIYSKVFDEDLRKMEGMEHLFINHLRRFKTRNNLKGAKIGLISHEHYELMILNNIESAYLPEIRNIIFSVFEEEVKANAIFIGVGIPVKGIENIDVSYERAHTAMRMAVYYKKPYIRFEDMGFHKLLFSVKSDDLLYEYANEILAPIDEYDKKHGHEYMELLRAYIHNDRSLERTAQELYLHRNTINYRVQNLKKILDCDLKTLEDMFPYQVALAIRDMEKNSPHARETML